MVASLGMTPALGLLPVLGTVSLPAGHCVFTLCLSHKGGGYLPGVLPAGLPPLCIPDSLWRNDFTLIHVGQWVPEWARDQAWPVRAPPLWPQ